mmetsp:Transcript_7859/g.10241  ORF Transcript_7859/g.10241 Transcript_7859/m.10241 type:complete len:311 (-) Transcript_7859:2210-3142(-)
MDLPPANRLDACADDLRVIGRLEHDKGDQRRVEAADRTAQCQRHQEVEPEDNQDQRHRADQVHIACGRQCQGEDAGEPHQGEAGAQDDAADHGQKGEPQRQLQPLPQERKVVPDDGKIKITHGSALSDETRDPGVFFQGLRNHGRTKRNDHIDDGCSGKGLKPLKGVFGDLLALRGQFQKPDSERQRRVLKDGQELGCHRRHDQPEGNRQQHIAVGLRGGEAVSVGGAGQAGADGVYPSADLFRNAAGGVEAQADYSRDVLRVGHVPLHPAAEIVGDDFGHDEVPKEQLHQKRHVAEKLDIDGAEGGNGP